MTVAEGKVEVLGEVLNEGDEEEDSQDEDVIEGRRTRCHVRTAVISLRSLRYYTSAETSSQN